MSEIRELRFKTNLTQKGFSEKYGIPLSTLRKWEQGESRTPYYVLRYIESSLPDYKEDYEKIINNKKDCYFLDRKNKRIGDSLGNWISFNEDINNVNKENLVLYIDNLFQNYYKVIKSFDNDLFFDKKEKIIWR